MYVPSCSRPGSISFPEATWTILVKMQTLLCMSGPQHLRNAPHGHVILDLSCDTVQGLRRDFDHGTGPPKALPIIQHRL